MLKERILIDLNEQETDYKEIYNNCGDYMSTTTKWYQPVEHSVIHEAALASMDHLGVDFTETVSHEKNGRDFFAKFTLEGFNEEVKPQIVMRNTYKSGKSLKLYTGAFTMACSNGSVIGKRHSELTHLHVKDLNEAMFVSNIKSFIESYPQHLEFLEKLKEKQISEAAAIEVLEGLKLPKSTQKAIFELFGNGTNTAPTNRRDNTLHCLYQSATEFFTHKKVNEDSRMQSLEKIGIAFDLMVA